MCVRSGIAAVLLNAYPSASPAEVLQLLRYHSVQRVINPEALPPEHHLTTPDMVAALPTSAATGQNSGLTLCMVHNWVQLDMYNWDKNTYTLIGRRYATYRDKCVSTCVSPVN